MTLLLHINSTDEAAWAEKLQAALGSYKVVTRRDDFRREDIRYILVWRPEPDAFEGLDRLKAVFSTGAGVDALLTHPGLPEVPLVRFVDDLMTQYMSDYVVANIAMHHRLFARFSEQQKKRSWREFYPPAATEVAVGIMGMGVLGQDAAGKLTSLGYTVNGWSRSARSVPDVNCFAGAVALDAFLAASDMLVCLLPLTPETRGILNYNTLSKLRRTVLPDGPALINAARGGHQVEGDLVKALSDGTLSAASLDVFETEPLPPDNPLWDLPNCFITPHVAAASDQDAGTHYFAQMIHDHEAGMPLRNLVDRDRGY